MNLLLVESRELAADGTCTLADRRAEHLRRVLRVVPGSTVRAGIVGGALGSAEIVADDGTAIVLRVVASSPPPPQLDLALVLAIPRPKALSRVIETCGAFAVRRIVLTNAWRVDKSYLRSPRLEPAALSHAARLGAEQGATTLLPEIEVHERLMAMLDGGDLCAAGSTPEWECGSLDERFPVPAGARLIAHPGAPPIEAVVTELPQVLAVGPEGGWIERELDTFVARGFQPCSPGTPILRVEPAVAALLAQLLLLQRQLSSRPGRSTPAS